MKLATKIFKILFGSILFLYAVCAMAVAPYCVPRLFAMDILRLTELIMFYLAMHGISIVVWAVKNHEPIHDFRIEIPHEN